MVLKTTAHALRLLGPFSSVQSLFLRSKQTVCSLGKYCSVLHRDNGKYNGIYSLGLCSGCIGLLVTICSNPIIILSRRSFHLGFEV